MPIKPDFSPANGPKVGLEATLELVSWLDVEDVCSDRGVLMTKLIEAADEKDYKMPKDMGVAQIAYKVTDKATGAVLAEAGSAEAPVAHQIDETEIALPAIELALKKMKAGGKSELNIVGDKKYSPFDGSPALTVELFLASFENEADRCALRLSLSPLARCVHEWSGRTLRLNQCRVSLAGCLSFLPCLRSWDLEEDAKLAGAEAKKDAGNAKFKAGDLGRAQRRYEAAKTMLVSDYKMDDAQKEKCKALKVGAPLAATICFAVHPRRTNAESASAKLTNERLRDSDLGHHITSHHITSHPDPLITSSQVMLFTNLAMVHCLCLVFPLSFYLRQCLSLLPVVRWCSSPTWPWCTPRPRATKRRSSRRPRRRSSSTRIAARRSTARARCSAAGTT
eukprot:SAG22_NODE_101_length_20519_cov_15.588002_29_plen_394_part_00